MMKIAHWIKLKLKSLKSWKRLRKDWKGTKSLKIRMKINMKNKA